MAKCNNCPPDPRPQQQGEETPEDTKCGFCMKTFAGTLIVLLIISVCVYVVTRDKKENITTDEVYDLSAYEKTAPEMIGYKKVETWNLGVKDPVDISIASSILFIVGAEEIVVCKQSDFNLSGIEVESKTERKSVFSQGIKIDTKRYPLSVKPLSVFGNADGSFYIASGDYVYYYSADGKEQKKWQAGENCILTGLAVSEKEIFAADAEAKVVRVINKADGKVRLIGQKNEETGDDGIIVYAPHLDVVLGADGLLRITDPGRQRVKLYQQDGTFVSAWKSNPSNGIKGFCGCCNPAAICLLDDGSVVTSEKSIARVKVYDVNGSFVTVVAPPEFFQKGQALHAPVATDASGTVYVVRPGDGSLSAFRREKGGEE